MRAEERKSPEANAGSIPCIPWYLYQDSDPEVAVVRARQVIMRPGRRGDMTDT